MKNSIRFKRNGGAVVEFAMVGSLTFLLLFAIISMGVCVWCYNSLAEAVREGGRYASVNGSNSPSPVGSATMTYPGSSAPPIQQVLDSCFVMDPAQLSITATWLDGNNNPGSRVEVAATYKYNWFFGFPLFSSITLSTQTTMLIAGPTNLS